MITIFTPPGIGDVYWLLQKILPNTTEGLHIRNPPGKSPIHTRSSFLYNLPGVEKVTADGIPYSELVIRAKQYEMFESEMYLEANTWLEAGNRLDEYLPNFPIQWRLDWKISDGQRQHVQRLLDYDKKNIVVYTSGANNNNSTSTGSAWQAKDWNRLLQNLPIREDVNLIWIGAGYDKDILPMLNFNFNHVLIDENAGLIIELLRNCDGFVSYQSGLSCISVSESIPTFMLYFRKIDKLRFSICPPASIDNRVLYNAPFFDEVQTADLDNWLEEIAQ